MAIGSHQSEALSDLKKLRMAEQMGASKYLFMSLLMLFHVIHCRVLTVSEIEGVKLPQQPKSFRIDLIHRDSLISPLSPGNNISSTERWKRLVERSNERLLKFQLHSRSYSHKVSDIKDPQAPVSAGTGEFLMKLAIGTPAVSYSAILDTGSDLTWTQCKPCVHCYTQPTPIFDPSKSSSYSTVPCSTSLCAALPQFGCSESLCKYNYTYGDSSSTAGTLSYETFTLTAEELPHIAFGCGKDNQGIWQGGGLRGFGRGPLSFISQIGPSVGNKFSYCLVSTTDPPSKTSPLIVGSAAGLNTNTFASTPLLKNSLQQTFYYLSLEGISVGNKALDIPAGTFDLDADGSGGIIIDSGTPITRLEQSGYDAVKQGLLSAVSLPQADGSSAGFDLCYTSAAADFPSITFHFKGADYVVGKENYLYHDPSGVVCLAMLPSSELSIFGNFQQQNFHILYDLDSSTLSFAPAVCDSL